MFQQNLSKMDLPLKWHPLYASDEVNTCEENFPSFSRYLFPVFILVFMDFDIDVCDIVSVNC